jgi:hypothetical protein
MVAAIVWEVILLGCMGLAFYGLARTAPRE